MQLKPSKRPLAFDARQLAWAVAVGLLAAMPSRADDRVVVSSETLVYGDTDNVVIVSPQLGLRHRIDEDGSEVSASAVIDSISAASVDVVSHATDSFDEVRYEGDLSFAYALGDFVPSLSYRGSVEPDYVSHGGRLGVTAELGTSDSVLSLGYGLTYDTITRSGSPASAFEEHLASHAADVSFTQVLSERMVLRAVYSLTYQSGYQEKAYRHVPLFTAAAVEQAGTNGVRLDLDSFEDYSLSTRPPEEVPETRHRHAVAVRLLRYFPDSETALRLDYQLYGDGWGLIANTFEVGVQHQLSEAWALATWGRFYHQGSASFWQRSYTVDALGTLPRYRSIDRDLSSYTTVSAGLRFEWAGEHFGLFAEGGVRHTLFHDFLFLDQLTGLVGMGGLRAHF